MSGHVLTPRAQADLDDIWDYTLNRWNSVQAERYIRQVQRGIERVASDPRIADACDDIRAGYSKYLVGSHVVFFRVASAGGIEVVRILHASMDFKRHV